MMEANPIVAFGINLISILSVTKESQLKWLKVFVVYLPVSITALFAVLDLFDGEDDIDTLTNIIFNIVLYTHAFSRFIILVQHYNKILEICAEFKTLERNFSSPRHTTCKENNIKIESTILYYTKLYTKACYLIGGMYFIKPLFYQKRIFTLWTWNISKVTVSPLYEIILINDILCFIIISTSVFSVTVVKIGLITQLVMSVRVLKEQIKTGMLLFIDDCDGDRKCKEFLRKCVGYHDAIIKSANDIRRVLSKVFCFRLAISLHVISIGLYEASNYDRSMALSRILYSCFILIGGTIDFLPGCFLGTIFSHEMASISDAVYECEWWEYSSSVRRYLLVMMLRSQQAMHLNAYSGVFNINLEFFVSVIKTAYSMFTVLRTMKIKSAE